MNEIAGQNPGPAGREAPFDAKRRYSPNVYFGFDLS
jgi:hypothetical protein